MVSFPRACLAVARVAPGAFEDEDDASTVHIRDTARYAGRRGVDCRGEFGSSRPGFCEGSVVGLGTGLLVPRARPGWDPSCAEYS
jgi:hypothetical protein